jgi:hypothetical protein
MKIKLPTALEVLNHKNWTGFSLTELVDLGRVQPEIGAGNWVAHFQKEHEKSADFALPLDQIGEYVKIWEQLEYEVLDALLKVEA